MTPLLEAWQNEAHVLGIPWDIQRGLLFVLGLEASFKFDNDLDGMFEVGKRLSPHFPPADGKHGGNLYVDRITGLFIELAAKMGHPIEPAIIESPSGNRISTVLPPDQQVLPATPHLDQVSLSLLHTTFLDQLGRCIFEDPEGCFLGGSLFGGVMGSIDPEIAWTFMQAATRGLPPHLSWLRRAVRFSPEEISAMTEMEKMVRGTFLPEEPLMEFWIWIYNHVFYKETGERRDVAWDLDLAAFLELAVSFARGQFSQDGFDDDLRDGQKRYAELGPPQPPCSEEEAVERARKMVLERYGIDVDSREALKPYEELGRRTTVFFIAVANEFLIQR